MLIDDYVIDPTNVATLQWLRMKFVECDVSSLPNYSFDGVPLPELSTAVLQQWASSQGLPTLSEPHIRMVLCALLVASGSGSVSNSAWRSLREQAAGLLILAIRRDGCLTSATVAALNLLNKAEVVERYKTHGNKWTMQPNPGLRARGDADARAELERARCALGGKDSEKLGDWLRSLADVLDEEPASSRPWYMSKFVLIILLVVVAFISVHVLLLARVLQKVHVVDSSVLRYPLMGLGASSLVGGIAVGISKLSDISAPKRA